MMGWLGPWVHRCYLEWDFLERGPLPVALSLCMSCLFCMSHFVIAGDKALLAWILVPSYDRRSICWESIGGGVSGERGRHLTAVGVPARGVAEMKYKISLELLSIFENLT